MIIKRKTGQDDCIIVCITQQTSRIVNQVYVEGDRKAAGKIIRHIRIPHSDGPRTVTAGEKRYRIAIRPTDPREIDQRERRLRRSDSEAVTSLVALIRSIVNKLSGHGRNQEKGYEYECEKLLQHLQILT